MISRAINMNPSQGDAWAYVAMSYARQGKMDNASQARDAFVKAVPKGNLSIVENPVKSSAEAYKRWHATQFVPAWRKAGLPE